jgi:hypothetical protein
VAAAARWHAGLLHLYLRPPRGRLFHYLRSHD